MESKPGVVRDIIAAANVSAGESSQIAGSLRAFAVDGDVLLVGSGVRPASIESREIRCFRRWSSCDDVCTCLPSCKGA